MFRKKLNGEGSCTAIKKNKSILNLCYVITFALLILIHGIIRFSGFTKAFGYTTIVYLKKDILKRAGMLCGWTGFCGHVTQEN